MLIQEVKIKGKGMDAVKMIDEVPGYGA